MADLLIVDDNQDITELLETLMLGEGYTVRVACNGEEGLRALDERLPDVVILDVDMPVLDGPGMAYRMFVEDCGRDTIPIVLVSGTYDLSRPAQKVGTPYALAKPFDPDALLALVTRALAEQVPPTPTLR